jgi:hypothetical protein
MQTVFASNLPLHHADIDDSSWPVARWNIAQPRKSKKPGVYFRVLRTVISTAPIAFDKSPPIRNEDAIRRIGAALKTVVFPAVRPKRFQPVTTSRVWAIGKPPKGEGVLIAALSGGISMETILQEMRHHNVEAESCGFGTSVVFPPETDDARIGVILESLRQRQRQPFVRVDPPEPPDAELLFPSEF